MELEKKTSSEISINEGDYDKEWVSIESLKEFIFSDQIDKFREAFPNKNVKSTISKLLEKLKNERKKTNY